MPYDETASPQLAERRTRYSSISLLASCFLLSQFGMRPRPDHITLVTGSRINGPLTTEIQCGGAVPHSR